MYSRNDYRYYLERRLNSDYLAHERSHKYIKKIGDRYFYTQQELAAFLNKDRPQNNASNMGSGLLRGISNPMLGNSTIEREQQRGMKRTKEHQVRELNRIGDHYNRELDVVKKEAHGSKSSVSRSTIERNTKEANERGKKQTAKINSERAIKAEQSRGRARTEQTKGSPEYNAEKAYNSKTNAFPKSTNQTTKKKKSLKAKIKGVRKKYGLYRETPKGKKLSGGGNIYVSHD